MNVELLIHAVVRQTTILIAQLATSQGIRAPLAQIADQVFKDLVDELDRQGVGRKVSADMFGMGLRTYRRKVQRLSESFTMRGRSLWETVFGYIKERGPVDRTEVAMRFSGDDETQVKAILHDLCESQLIVASGSGTRIMYRPAEGANAAEPSAATNGDAEDDLLVALMYREGPLTLEQIAARAQDKPVNIAKRLARLVQDGRIQRSEDENGERYKAEALIIPLGAERGWEGAVFDHYKALVATILARLNGASTLGDNIGGSTYTFEVWPGHPMEQEVLDTLKRLRASLSEVRSRVVNSDTGERPSFRKSVTVYVGQHVIEEDDENGT